MYVINVIMETILLLLIIKKTSKLHVHLYVIFFHPVLLNAIYQTSHKNVWQQVGCVVGLYVNFLLGRQ